MSDVRLYMELGDALDALDADETALVAMKFEVAVSTVRGWREMRLRPAPRLVKQILDYVDGLVDK